PTGIDVLWGRYELLAQMPPFLTGGSMIEIVHMDHSTYAEPPARFEAGTPPVSQAVGLAAACDYLDALGMERIAAHEQSLTQQALDGLAGIDGVRVIGPAASPQRTGAVCLDIPARHPHDVGQVLDSLALQVRVRHHCACPLHRRVDRHGATRASVAVRRTAAQVDAFVSGVAHPVEYFGSLACAVLSPPCTPSASSSTTSGPCTQGCASRSVPRSITSPPPAGTRSPCGCSCPPTAPNGSRTSPTTPSAAP